MKSDELEKLKREAEQSAAAWFLTLERAKQANDFELAATAQRELMHLGIRVTYTAARDAGREGGINHAV